MQQNKVTWVIFMNNVQHSMWIPYDIIKILHNTKLSMLYKILSVGEALWVILDELSDKTTVQCCSAA